MQQHCITCSLQANSVYKFFTFGNLLLAISWNLLNLWIVHTLFQLYTRSHFPASSCSCLHCYGYTYICLTYSTTIKTACTIQTCCIYIQQNFRSSQMPVAVILQWIHTPAELGLYFACTEWRRKCTTALYLSETILFTVLSYKVDLCTHSSSIAMLLFLLISSSCFSH